MKHMDNNVKTVIGTFEFMGLKICDVTKENYKAIRIIQVAIKHLLTEK